MKSNVARQLLNSTPLWRRIKIIVLYKIKKLWQKILFFN